MTQAQKKERALAVIDGLKALYPDAACALCYGNDPWRLLVMGRLSAQCTDKRVNIVCEKLFEVYPDAQAMAEADLAEVEALVKPCGLYHVKARDVVEASKKLVTDFGGNLPDTMEALLTLPGVGRKIANLLLGDIFHLPAVVCDTHCIRICGRLGFYPETLKDPRKIETVLTAILPPAEGSEFCHRIVDFGRDVCTARAPKCAGCPLGALCEHAKKSKNG